jgi:hypothetical protein
MLWKQGLAIMVWHDLDASVARGSGATGDPVYRLDGQASSLDGRRVEWHVETSDGRTAQFWIDGTSYDLEAGSVFVITTRTGTKKVHQLQRDLSGIQPNYESCVAFARSDPVLAHLLNGPPTAVATRKSPAYGLADLLDDLRALGLGVVPTERAVDHGFAIEGTRVLVDDVPVFVYAFADAEAAQTAAAGVTTDEYSVTIARTEGEVTYETHGDWMETPHVYLKGRLIVITGNDPGVLEALNGVLGPALAAMSTR